MIYAIVKDEKVINVVEIGDIKPLRLIFPDADEYIEFTINSGAPEIGRVCKAGKFQPFLSWTFDKRLSDWVAPEPQPEGECYWDEAGLTWIVVEPAETESPT